MGLLINPTTGKLDQAGSSGGAVSSVSNSDGSLVISPTTGAVIVSINTSNQNYWLDIQYFGNGKSFIGVDGEGMFLDGLFNINYTDSIPYGFTYPAVSFNSLYNEDMCGYFYNSDTDCFIFNLPSALLPSYQFSFDGGGSSSLYIYSDQIVVYQDLNIVNSKALIVSGQTTLNNLTLVYSTSSNQFTVGYDISNKVQVNVSSTGLVTLNAVGASAGFTFSDDVSVPDEVYGVAWNGSLEVPTKNALYDKIETIVAGGGITTSESIAYAVSL